MADASLEGFRDRASLRRALADRLRELDPKLSIVAEGFLAESSTIDLLAVGGEGELVSIRFAKPEDDRATLTRVLADLSWLRPRRADLLNLAPGLGIDPSVEPRALVVCHEFSTESRAAVDNFPVNTVALLRCRSRQMGSERVVFLEPVIADARDLPLFSEPTVGATRTTARTAEPIPSSPTLPRPSRPTSSGLTDPPSPSAFRSRLVDTDLDPSLRSGSDPFSEDGIEADELFYG
ncbi:hypothetical protein K2X89_04900 [Myxococcota bacterium]|nr:hypothetical protein [Myxococcota bacterium]